VCASGAAGNERSGHARRWLCRRGPNQRWSLDFVWAELNEHPFGMQRLLERSINFRVGILSLTEDPLNIFMWGHYADSYRGSVIQFDSTHNFFLDRMSDDEETQFTTAVNYSKKLASFDFNYATRKKKIKGGDYNFRLEAPISLVRERHPLFYTKSRHWAYEKEWRVVRCLAEPDAKSKELWSESILVGYPHTPPVTSQQLIPVPAEAVKAIIIGPRSNLLSEALVMKQLKKDSERRHIEVHRAVFNHSKFEVNTLNLRDPGQWLGKMSLAEIHARRNNPDDYGLAGAVLDALI
jgi:hypothetical protein